MTRIAPLVEQAAAATAALLAEVRRAGMSASDWADAVTAVERIGRLVDATRIAVAAPAVTTGREVPEAALAAGARSGVDALARLAGVSEPEARRRLTLAAATTETVAISGGRVPPRMPRVAEAMREGRIGTEAATTIVRELERVGARASRDDLDAAEDALVLLGAARDAASSPAPAEFVADAAKHWAAAIDPDGVRPREERMMRRRGLRIGAEDADGLIPISGRLALVPGLLLKSLVEAHRRGGGDVAFGGPGAAARDERTPDQQRHDAFAAIVTGAARAADAPTVGGTAPAVLVTVSAADLEDPEGRSGDAIGRVEGSSTPVSRREVERLVDAAGLQPIVLSPGGAVAGIGSAQRCFTPAQRRALIARDGGCIIPGCRIPAGWCEVHHVIPWRDGGRTRTDNGTLLCWWHHCRIDIGPWSIRMIDGIPHVRGPGYPEWTPRRPVTPRPTTDTRPMSRPPTGRSATARASTTRPATAGSRTDRAPIARASMRGAAEGPAPPGRP